MAAGGRPHNFNCESASSNMASALPSFEAFEDDSKAVFSDAFELSPEHVFVDAPVPERTPAAAAAATAVAAGHQPTAAPLQ